MNTDVSISLDLQQKIKSLQGEINSKLLTLKSMQQRLEKYYELLELGNEYNKKTKINVTDHALLRTVERIYGVKLKDIKNNLLPKEVVKRINFIGKGKGSISYGGITYVVDNFTIITVYRDTDVV